MNCYKTIDFDHWKNKIKILVLNVERSCWRSLIRLWPEIVGNTVQLLFAVNTEKTFSQQLCEKKKSERNFGHSVQNP